QLRAQLNDGDEGKLITCSGVLWQGASHLELEIEKAEDGVERSGREDDAFSISPPPGFRPF
ncbi:hypothetical protein, partial [Roseibacillus ishigakijimensis]|uniref:hypothetical protein n=1 Tax=Roseibacillus ishigakijimensis TaxID=454146 RepID=UPI001F2A6984